MKITKRQLRRIIKEMANQEQDFVVGGYSGGYSSDSERYDYIVSAINKRDAKKKLKDAKPHLKKINAAPVTDYTELDPYSTFERLGESVNFSRGAQVKITKRQLRKLIREGRMKEMEMQIMDEIVELLEERGAIRRDSDDVYDEALHYIQNAVIPALQSLVDDQAV